MIDISHYLVYFSFQIFHKKNKKIKNYVEFIVVVKKTNILLYKFFKTL